MIQNVVTNGGKMMRLYVLFNLLFAYLGLAYKLFNSVFDETTRDVVSICFWSVHKMITEKDNVFRTFVPPDQQQQQQASCMMISTEQIAIYYRFMVMITEIIMKVINTLSYNLMLKTSEKQDYRQLLPPPPSPSPLLIDHHHHHDDQNDNYDM